METTEKNMEHGEHFNESIVNEVILEDMKKNRIDHMKYLPGMEVLEESDVMDQVISAMNAYDYDKYTEADVRRALAHDNRTPEDFQALLSPAALPLLEEIAQAAQKETRKHFGNSVYMFTPIYIANYCENYCIYCGFNCHNKIRRAKLNAEEIDKEMAAIAKTGLQEILILTGESRAKSDVKYIGEACKIARKYFKVIGLEVYPMNSDEYAHLHECGADYVTVFQETYNSDKYETLHLAGHKRIFPYRLNAQERALKGGMRGVGFAALLGLDDFRKDAFATGYHAYLLQRKYPHAEIAFSCPRLRPITIMTVLILWMYMNHSCFRWSAPIVCSCHLQALRYLPESVSVSAITWLELLRQRFQQESAQESEVMWRISKIKEMTSLRFQTEGL